jgi:hypothetical protein
MEGFLKTENTQFETESNIESLSDWRNLKAEAETQAELLINEISDFEKLNTSQKVDALKSLLVSLDGDNGNRFIAEAIAIKLSVVLETDRHANRMALLEMS